MAWRDVTITHDCLQVGLHCVPPGMILSSCVVSEFLELHQCSQLSCSWGLLVGWLAK